MAEPADFDPNEVLQQAMQRHQSGDFPGAEALYRKLLHRFPSHIQLLNVLGALELQMGNLNKGIVLLGRSLGLKPDQPDVLTNRALGLRALNLYDEALECYEAALKLTPDNAALMAGKGYVLMAQGRSEDALNAYTGVITRNPEDGEAFYNRGTIYLTLEKHPEALADFDRALALLPNHVNAHINRGTTLEHLKREPDALKDFRKATELDPQSAAAWNSYGNALKNTHDFSAALTAYDRALRLSPNNPDMHFNRGIALVGLQREGEALAEFDRAVAENPRHDAAYNNRGNALIALGRLEEALASLNRAIAINPRNAEAFVNRGNVLRALDRPEEALTSFDRAIAIHPEHPEALANKAVTLLQNGDFETGWKLYDWRWKCEEPSRAFLNFSHSTIQTFRQDIWKGGVAPSGFRLLVNAEQGFGDNIQFCRYLPLLKDRGIDVFYQVPAALVPLMHSLRGNIPIIANGEKLPAFDQHCPVMSLPHAFGTTLETVPADVPYLFADQIRRQSWQQMLGPKIRPRIGLAWSGNPKHSNDAARSMTLAQLSPLFDLPFDFHIVQKDLREEERAEVTDYPNLSLHSAALEDFAETAALISKMDLVISVDTSVGHLAGALGKPVWLMLTWVSEWRWLRTREDSPWYPNAKLFRQKKRDAWDEVVMDVAAALVSRFSDLL